MEIVISPEPIAQVDCDALVVNLFENEKVDASHLRELDFILDGALCQVVDLKELSGKRHETATVLTSGKISAPRVLVVGAGPRSEFTGARARDLAGVAVRHLTRRGASRIAFALGGDLPPATLAQMITEGALLGLFDPGLYKTRTEDRTPLERLIIVRPPTLTDSTPLDEGARRGQIIAESTNYARRMAAEPANVMTPSFMADCAREVAEQAGLEVQVFEQADLERMGAGAILGVARGSEQPPVLIALRYRSGRTNGPVLGLVGKGVTFDTGGISLKPAERMHEMKYDMAGGAAVIAAMRAIGLLKPGLDVIGVVPAVENMPSGRALKPGDILRALNGKTIEVLNTDAEGRLILADALVYAQQQGATHLVDAATLTGAIVVALGHVTTGLFGFPDAWVDQVRAAADEAGERVWPLPLFAEYYDQLRSDIADIANVGGRPAGAITAAMFLKEFIAEGVAWAHLDIAGTAWTDKDQAHLAKGPTGVAVRTFVALAGRLAGGT